MLTSRIKCLKKGVRQPALQNHIRHHQMRGNSCQNTGSIHELQIMRHSVPIHLRDHLTLKIMRYQGECGWESYMPRARSRSAGACAHDVKYLMARSQFRADTGNGAYRSAKYPVESYGQSLRSPSKRMGWNPCPSHGEFHKNNSV